MISTKEQSRAFPWGILAVITVLSLVEPLTHVWIQQFPPEGAVHTGMHVGDSAISRHYMDSIVSGFYSPYATEAHRADGKDYRLYMPPHALLYGLFGLLNRLLRIDPFLYLGLVNGFACALYLIAARRFLREALPRHGRSAFYLFSLGGGLGGVAFAVCWLLGCTDAPGFQANFQRLAHYELIEGQHLSPLLLSTRIYYTLPLAAGIYGLTLLVRASRRPGWAGMAFAGLLIALAGFVNLRLGPLFWALALAWIVLSPARRGRAAAALWVTIPTAAAAAACWRLMALNYHIQENLAAITGMAAWFVSLLSCTLFFWLAVLPLVRARRDRLPRGAFCLVHGALGYLAAYAALYAAHIAYYGNWLRGGETAAAITASDAALLGGALGLAYGWRRSRKRPESSLSDEDRVLAWLLLWLLGFTSLSLSAFGHGWFLRFTPQRLMVLLPLPLAALAALGLAALPRRVSLTLRATILGCGIVSLAVASLYFQGALGRQPGEGPFAYLHYEYVTEADAELMTRLPAGTVLAPPWSPIYFGEILSLRPGIRVLGGGGAAALCELPYAPLQAKVNRFFNPGTSMNERRAIAAELGIGAVFCPDTCPVEQEVAEQLNHTPWLHLQAKAGRGRIYLVDRAVAVESAAPRGNAGQSSENLL